MIIKLQQSQIQEATESCKSECPTYICRSEVAGFTKSYFSHICKKPGNMI